MDANFSKELDYYKSIGLFNKNEQGKLGFFNNATEEEASKQMEEFFYNHTLATSQIIELTTVDLAFYKKSGKDVIDDFSKRYKEVTAASRKPYTNAKYKGQTVGKKYDRVVLLKDEEIQASFMPMLEHILNDNKELSAVDKAFIKTKYKKVCVTDA